MRMLGGFVTITLFSLFGASSPAPAQSSIEGDWIGTLTSGSYWTFIKVRFETKVIVVGGGGVSPTEHEIYRREKNLREAGFSEAEIEKALEHQRLKFDFVRRLEAAKLDMINEETKKEK